MTELKPYPKYKDSGVEWIGEIPERWEITKYKRIFKIQNGNGFPNNLQGEKDGDYPFLKVSDISFTGKYVTEAENYVTESTIIDRKWNIIPNNSIITAKIGEALRKNHRKINKVSCLIDNNIMALSPSERYHLDYLFYTLSVVDFDWYSNPGAIPSLNNRYLREDYLVIPTLNEQKIIAEYLNSYTSKIDLLITDKERLIKVLEEKRQAVITEAVTKGLDPNVKMKNSGIEWIGEIPEHWSMSRFKRYMNVKNGKEILDENNSDKDKKYNVYGSGGAFKQTKHYLHEGKSVLFGRKGTIGKPIFVDEKFWTVDTMYYTEFKNTALAEYFYFILTIFPWETISTNTAIPSVVGTDVENSYIAVPPLEEQKKIIKILNDKTRELDSIVELISNQISKLQEYRESLIYEAVTGKIDLREYSLEKEQTDWNDMGKVAELNETYQ